MIPPNSIARASCSCGMGERSSLPASRRASAKQLEFSEALIMWAESKWGGNMRNGDHRLWKGVVAGAAGGLVASWVMSQFQAGWSKVQAKMESDRERHQHQTDDEDATMKTAGKLAHAFLHRNHTLDVMKK